MVRLHAGLWVLLIGAFLFFGTPTTYHEVLSNRIGSFETNHTIDAYLLGLTGVTDGAQRLHDLLERLPRGKPLVIFVRDENSQSEFLGMLIGYVSWPREIQIVKVAGADAEKELAQISPATVGGLIFCLVDSPQWLGKGIHFGSAIRVYSLLDIK